MELRLSSLPKTWIFDLDGTLVVHNGYLTGKDQLLPGVKELFDKIPKEDYILILTARSEKYLKQTESFLRQCGLRYDLILSGIPVGERILFNDCKPSGLLMAYAVNQKRDSGCDLNFMIDKNL
mgnify:CR=1 FL=1